MTATKKAALTKQKILADQEFLEGYIRCNLGADRIDPVTQTVEDRSYYFLSFLMYPHAKVSDAAWDCILTALGRRRLKPRSGEFRAFELLVTYHLFPKKIRRSKRLAAICEDNGVGWWVHHWLNHTSEGGKVPVRPPEEYLKSMPLTPRQMKLLNNAVQALYNRAHDVMIMGPDQSR